MSLIVFFPLILDFVKNVMIRIRVWGRRKIKDKKNLQMIYNPYLDFSGFFDFFLLFQTSMTSWNKTLPM